MSNPTTIDRCFAEETCQGIKLQRIEVNNVDILFPVSSKKDVSRLVIGNKEGFLREINFVSIVTQLTDTKQVMLKTINKCNLFNGDIFFFNQAISQCVPSVAISKSYILDNFFLKLGEHGLISKHVPWVTNIKIPEILYSSLHT